MAELTAQEIRENWFKVELIRGIPLPYKGKEMVFPVVYMRPSHMADQEVFNKVSGEDVSQSNEASKKLFTFVTRVIAEDGYDWNDKEAIEEIGKAQRKIKPLEKKFEQAETEEEKDIIQDEIKEIRKDLKYPNHPYSGDETVLRFVTECFKTEKTRTVDFVRLSLAFKEINLLEEEELDNFLTLPKN